MIGNHAGCCHGLPGGTKGGRKLGRHPAGPYTTRGNTNRMQVVRIVYHRCESSLSRVGIDTARAVAADLQPARNN